MSNFDNFGQSTQVYSWDAPTVAQEQKEFVKLEPGIYPFTVVEMPVKEHYEPKATSKIPACPHAQLVLEVGDEQTGTMKLYYHLFYYEKMMWKVDDIFIGCGLAKENQSYVPNPDMLLGATGWCEVKQVPSYKDPTQMVCEIKKVLREAPKAGGFGGF